MIVVTLLYTNGAGSPPPAADLIGFVALLQNGTFTHASLGLMAGNHELNAVNVELVGMVETGLEYISII